MNSTAEVFLLTRDSRDTPCGLELVLWATGEEGPVRAVLRGQKSPRDSESARLSSVRDSIYPHLKYSYWPSVNYGMVLEAERLGVALQVAEAGGYPNLARQIAQVKDCTAGETDILVGGTVSFEGHTPTVLEIARRMPVTAVVNDIADAGISAKTGVS